MDLEKGKLLIGIAREAIQAGFKNEELDWKSYSDFQDKQGVFVTIHTYPEKKLRGCIGFPYPEISLAKAIVESAHAAAFSDPRFPALERSELNNIIIEISLLTKPKEIKIKKEERPDIYKKIEIGKDGLIVEYEGRSGLLLPQVPLDFGWNSEEFLKQACLKAGLSPQTYLNEKCKISKFQAQIFSEEKPNGNVIEKKISK